MIIDCHVHLGANTAGHGMVSPSLQRTLRFRALRWIYNFHGTDEQTERKLERKLAGLVADAPELDAAVVLAFDAVYTPDGKQDPVNTQMVVGNDYAVEVCARHPNLLFGASVHPYRKDAIAELERCVKAGAVLLKWLPISQNFRPDDPLCFPFYEALAHHRLPLLCHTGFEQMMPNLDLSTADPTLLRPALERGVTVIAAHCGTRSTFRETDYLPHFMRMAREYEHFYGDTAALNLPARWYAFEKLLDDPIVRGKLVHGSDWPVVPLPPFNQLGWDVAADLLLESNWIRRDLLTKRQLGFDDAYWHRAGGILRLPAVPEKSDVNLD